MGQLPNVGDTYRHRRTGMVRTVVEVTGKDVQYRGRYARGSWCLHATWLRWQRGADHIGVWKSKGGA